MRCRAGQGHLRAIVKTFTCTLNSQQFIDYTTGKFIDYTTGAFIDYTTGEFIDYTTGEFIHHTAGCVRRHPTTDYKAPTHSNRLPVLVSRAKAFKVVMKWMGEFNGGGGGGVLTGEEMVVLLRKATHDRALARQLILYHH